MQHHLEVKLPTRRDALIYIQNEKLEGWLPYGVRMAGYDVYYVRPSWCHRFHDVNTTPPEKGVPKTIPQQAERRTVAQRDPNKPSAKSICLALWQAGTQERNAFIAEAEAQGVGKSTAATMFSDIRSGRIK